MKTSSLIGRALNWAVATCEGYKGDPVWVARQSSAATDWAQGGPIIEKHEITVGWDPTHEVGHMGFAFTKNFQAPMGYRNYQTGPTPLIAAMRCYVASKLGDEVEVPDEITV